MLHYSLLAGLRSGPETLSSLIRLVPASELDSPTAPGRFSPREVMAHLVDIEPLLLDRLRRGVEQPGCTVPYIDEDHLAAIGDYGQKDPVEMAERYIALRETSLKTIESLTPNQLTTTFNHPETGPLTVLEQVWIFLGHDHYHIAQLAQHLKTS